jgi:uncharacterized BrkB/YihY/UPF0761 family membrane protein
MKLDMRAFALAVGGVTAVVYVICAFFVAVSPGATAAFFSYLFHADLTGIVRPISWGSFVLGLVGTTLGMALMAAGVAWLYNRLPRSEEG